MSSMNLGLDVNVTNVASFSKSKLEAETFQIPHADLVDRCKAGDESAFRMLYKKYCRQMFSIAMRILQNQALSEDILQEAFATAFQKIETFSGDVSFGAWIKRIVINKSLNEVKRKKLPFADTEVEEVRVEAENEQEDKSSYPPLSVAQIRQGVALLPEGYRVVLSLFLFEKYSHKDIAKELGITESTSKSQYNRAKKKLKQILIEQFGINRAN